jgi:oligosaccharide repeat unit polymerase
MTLQIKLPRLKRAPRSSGGSDLGLVATWWLSPVGMTLGFLVPLLLFIAEVGQVNDASVTVRSMNFLTAGYLWLATGIMLAMALAGWVGGHIEPRTVPEAPLDRIESAAAFIGWVMLAVYLFGFRVFLLNPGTIIDFLQGWRPSRGDRVAGLTSLQNFGAVFFTLVAYLVFLKKRPLNRSLRFLTMVLAFFTLLRAYAMSERLAAIEIAVPAVICWLIAPGGRFERIKRIGRIGGPYVGLPLLIAYFAIGEYSRSWQAEVYHGKGSFMSFALGRLATYYYTALNNGAGGLTVNPDWPHYSFTTTLAWLHRFPLGIGEMFGSLVNARARGSGNFLELYGDPEFNNPSGIFAIVSDVGVVGGLIYYVLVGLLAGICYRRLIRGCLDGVLLYPMFVMNALEIYRYAYLSNQRAVPWALAIALTLLVVYRPQRGRLIKPRLSWSRKTGADGQRV